MTKAHLGLLLGLGLVLGTAVCQYKPHPQSGEMLCGSGDKRCPSGYECSPVDSKCYRPEDLPEFPPSTGGTTTASTSGGGGAAGGALSMTNSKSVTTGGQAGGATVARTSTATGGAAGASSISGGTTFRTTIVGGGGSVPPSTLVGGAGGSLSSKAGSGGTGGTVRGGTVTGGTLVSTAGTTSAGGAGGTSSGTSTIASVTFNHGRAMGAMTGWAWVAFGAQDIVTEPTCGAEELTAGGLCNSLTWTSKDALCISGSIPALPISPTAADYNDNWGISLGINATEATSGTLGQSYSSIAFTLTGAPLTGLRAQLHKKGERDDVSYCAALTPGTPLPLTSFSTNCYNDSSPGTAIKATDVPNIDKVNIQVYSSTAPITVSNLCITGITLIK